MSSSTTGKTKRPKKDFPSCDACRLRRVRCVREGSSKECKKCQEKGLMCTISSPKSRKKIFESSDLAEHESDYTSSERHRAGAESIGVTVAQASPPDTNLSRLSPEALLFTSELAAELAAHLMETYFAMSQYQLQLVQWDRLQLAFNDAGKRPRQMQPMAEVLAHVLIAFGARASDHSAILGPSSPKIGTLKDAPGALATWGLRRESICQALTEKAVRIADAKGAFRNNSIQSIAALWLLGTLVDHGDPRRKKGRPYRASCIGHLTSLAEEGSLPHIFRVGGILHTVLLGDTLTAASAGIRIVTNQGQFAVLYSHVELAADLPDAEQFSRLLHLLDAPSALAWTPITKLCNYLRTAATQFVNSFVCPDSTRDWSLGEVHVKTLWTSLDAAHSCIVAMDARMQGGIWPLSHFYRRPLRVYKLTILYLLYICHSALDARAGLDASVQSNFPPIGRSALQDLKAESHYRMLQGAKQMAENLWEAMNQSPGCGIMTGMHMIYEQLPGWADFLVRAPVAEEGGPADFPSMTKLELAQKMLLVFENVAWSWGDAAPAVSDLQLTVTRLRTGLISDFSSHMTANVPNDCHDYGVPLLRNPHPSAVLYPPTNLDAPGQEPAIGGLPPGFLPTDSSVDTGVSCYADTQSPWFERVQDLGPPFVSGQTPYTPDRGFDNGGEHGSGANLWSRWANQLATVAAEDGRKNI